MIKIQLSKEFLKVCDKAQSFYIDSGDKLIKVISIPKINKKKNANIKKRTKQS